ncbi:MAG: hypothetical protein Kow0092_07090 [Deferrisomatales bacterium]
MLAAGWVLLALGCAGPPPEEPEMPRGYLRRLELVHEGRLLGFGPFVGYGFRPVVPGRFDRLEFVCLNEGGFYSSDAPEGARLFEGEAVLATLPAEGKIPPGPERIRPVFFGEAPAPWLETRPGSLFRHFHSCHDANGPVRTGYWLLHRAVRGFTYDMGGRVGPGSPLFHPVTPGPDGAFAAIVEFDAGPSKGP